MSRDHPIGSDEPMLRGHIRLELQGNIPRTEIFVTNTPLRPQSAIGGCSTTRASRRPKEPQPTHRSCHPRPFRTSLIKSEL